MSKTYFIIQVLTLFFFATGSAQWSLKLNSSVELRTFKLTNKVDMTEVSLSGATISLFKGSSLVSRIQSEANGDFSIDVPANGEFILTVSYPGCNEKKFSISTMNVPQEVVKDSYKPSFSIEGVIMAKALPTIDYSLLKQPLVKILYTSNKKKFDNEKAHTSQMLVELSKIRDAENALIDLFTTTNNNGDVALTKGDCDLAKINYEKAMTIIVGENYPEVQLSKVGQCLKNKQQALKNTEVEAAAKLAAEKLATEKAATDKLASEKSIAKKVDADRLSKEKLAADKLQASKLAAEKVEADKLENDKGNSEKVNADRLLKEQLESQKIQTSKLAAENAQNDKRGKQTANGDKLDKAKASVEKPQVDSPAKIQQPTESLAKEKLVPHETELGGGILPTSIGSEVTSTGGKSREAKYTILQPLGDDKYKVTIKRADELFKMKRYAEAKISYEDALTQKPSDLYAANKLLEIEKFIKK